MYDSLLQISVKLKQLKRENVTLEMLSFKVVKNLFFIKLCCDQSIISSV